MSDKQNRKEVPLFSLKEAAARGVERVRQPNWANPLDHIKIDILPDGQLGPSAHLYSPFNKECSGRDPVDMLTIAGIGVNPSSKSFSAYTGPLPDSDEYRAAVAAFDGAFGGLGISPFARGAETMSTEKKEPKP